MQVVLPIGEFHHTLLYGAIIILTNRDYSSNCFFPYSQPVSGRSVSHHFHLNAHFHLSCMSEKLTILSHANFCSTGY